MFTFVGLWVLPVQASAVYYP